MGLSTEQGTIERNRPYLEASMIIQNDHIRHTLIIMTAKSALVDTKSICIRNDLYENPAISDQRLGSQSAVNKN
jgi:hypothetical protein